MNRHKDVETIDSEAFKTDWREQMNVGQLSDGYRHGIIEMLQEVEHMCNGLLGRAKFVEDRIERNSPDV